LGDDSAGVWIDHLRAVVEINLITVVVWRIVAGGDYNSCTSVQMANGKRKLRDRTRTIEHKRVATIFSCEFGRQLSEFFREESRVMRDHEFWLGRNSLSPIPVLQISNKPAGCAVDVEGIHR